jgi:hypothetical protein
VLILVSAIFTRVDSIGISSEQGEALRSFLITVTEMSVEVELKHDRSVLDEMKKACGNKITRCSCNTDVKLDTKSTRHSG